MMWTEPPETPEEICMRKEYIDAVCAIAHPKRRTAAVCRMLEMTWEEISNHMGYAPGVALMHQRYVSEISAELWSGRDDGERIPCHLAIRHGEVLRRRRARLVADRRAAPHILDLIAAEGLA